MTALDQYRTVAAAIADAEREASRPAGAVTLVAVSKTYDAEAIRPVLDEGHRTFGENRVQEAMGKWPGLRKAYPGIELHLIGPLQSNKSAEAVACFDVIETIDREKIAAALAAEMAKQGRRLATYVQVNTGEEPQKAGIAPREAVAFVERCRSVHGLDVVGLMCIPPAEENPGPHFALLEKLAREAGLPKLSMGMSGDYETAIAFGATSVRVGSAIFGARPPQG
ncbi:MULTISPECIES: YggS family pyridoxal phosphate-dependent enzyme [unclassified Aureimonas]|uniref:YggS family pyridoxal phosphate-dependent enzyme n=1 Tax=unclassified Aureimonas TaxID=2615206 RepID=UPI0006FA9D0F|nr:MULTISPECIES: YggS family pyridoxal phosphate-dependent enzyme [unclassified Aureimonas]KQT52601.1 alanine racemase [Aureimonas sp. Leaf427]KQT77499.1 alanine racemase [Aureimonas sp. Leaf460]